MAFRTITQMRRFKRVKDFFRLREFSVFLADDENRSWRERFYLWHMEHKFWQCGLGSSDCVFFIPVYDCPGWIRWFVDPLHIAGRGYAETRLWIKARTFWGMQKVDTGLRPSCYYDPDTLILHAVMSQVDRYIGEGEWIHSAEQEITDIAHWWNVERPAHEKRHGQMIDELFGRDSGYKTTSKPTDNPNLREIVFPEMGASWEARRVEANLLEKKIADDDVAYMHRVVDKLHHLWI